ncbi:MAG: phospholipase D-like domain-containing protein [Thermodesulfobacteriota bacterium]|nr:phospholipase D-like domain-containing protein [Thermodesulfobacteriota bacterium]
MKRFILILLFLSWPFLESPATAEIEALFSAEGDIKESLLKEMESVSETFDLALHEITSIDLAQVLIKVKQRGVRVRIVADARQAKMKTSKINFLIRQGIPVKVLGGKEKGAMNHRFAILDGKKVITGSYDWSEASARRDYESVLIIQESEVVTSYQREFDRLWREKRMIK